MALRPLSLEGVISHSSSALRLEGVLSHSPRLLSSPLSLLPSLLLLDLQDSLHHFPYMTKAIFALIFLGLKVLIDFVNASDSLVNKVLAWEEATL